MLIAVFITEMVILHKYVYLLLFIVIIIIKYCEFNMAAMFASAIEVAQCFCLFLHLYWSIKARV